MRGALSVLLISIAAGCKTSPPAADALTHSETTWCPEGFEVGPRDTCFAIPESHHGATPVLVYLHGMYSGHGSAEEWAVVRRATAQGFAVVVPRGKRGLCAWRAELQDHFCWPQDIDDPEPFRSVVGEWERVLWQVEALLERGEHKRYVLGFSHGGYFAEYIAIHDLFPAQAYAIVNGGALVPPTKVEKPKPLFLVAAQDDRSHKMKELRDALVRVGWPHAFCARGGGHALTAEDVETALRFFKKENEGTLRIQPSKDGASYACEGAAKPK